MKFIKENFWSIIGVSFLVLLVAAVQMKWLQSSLPTGDSVYVPFTIGFAALLDSVNPCAFSILFLTIAFLFSLGHDRKYILGIGSLYITGIFATYFLIGVGVLKTLSFFNISNGLSKFGAILIILFGLIGLLEVLIPNFPISLKIPAFAHKKIAPLINKGTKPAAFILGVVVGLFEFPCTGGPYVFVLGILHDQGQIITGSIYLFIYNLIFVLPLVIILLVSSTNKVAAVIDRARRAETKKARIWLAVAMIALGFVVLNI